MEVASRIPILRIFIHPSIEGTIRKRLWYTIKTLLIGAGYGWNAKTSINNCDILIAPPSLLENYPAIVRIPFYDKIISQPFNYQPKCIQRWLDYIVFKDELEKYDQLFDDSSKGRLIKFDLLGQVFWLLVGGHENQSKISNSYNIESKNILTVNRLLEKPIIEKLSKLIFNAFHGQMKPYPIWGMGKKWAVALTHDVDFTFFLRWHAFAKALIHYKDMVKAVKHLFQTNVDYWLFDRLIQEETNRNFRSAFYFCPRRGKAVNYLKRQYDTLYNIADPCFRNLFYRLAEEGFEIGLHASCEAYKSFNNFQEEVDMLKRYASITADIGNRHHCWRLNPESPNETLSMHEQVNLVYDSSLMFNFFNGLRRGTFLPFHIYDLNKEKAINTLQLCPVLMEDYMFSHKIYNNIFDPIVYIDKWIITTIKYGGLFVVDYHPHFMNEKLHQMERKSYMYLLDNLLNHSDVIVDTPINIAKYWLARERIIEKESLNEN